jgi:type IV fimbrial biogenesis protein FimT
MRGTGFTLVELVVSLAVMAILAALATPALQRLRAAAGITAAANQAVTGLHVARRIALSTGRTTTLCATTDGFRCGFGGTRWIVFSNGPAGSDARRDPGETVIREWPAPRGVMMSGTRGYAAYLAQPRAAATLTFTFSVPRFPDLTRQVIVSQTGRPRLVRNAAPQIDP